jgi:hypothetical protein
MQTTSSFMRNKEIMGKHAERKAQEMMKLASLDEEGQKAYLLKLKAKPVAKP